MKKPSIPFFAFLILLLLSIPFSFDFATSVVPGWHTVIYPPYFVAGFLAIVVLLLVTIGYWLLLKRADKTSWALFLIHFLLTIPAIMFLKFPSILLNVHESNQAELFKALSLRIKFIPVALILFVAGQILFCVYFIRTIKGKREAI
jgi:hypothetical protein